MKSAPRKSWGTKYVESKEWHRWYAWRPVAASCDKDDKYHRWVWREMVDRRWWSGFDGGCWEYRTLNNDKR